MKRISLSVLLLLFLSLSLPADDGAPSKPPLPPGPLPVRAPDRASWKMTITLGPAAAAAAAKAALAGPRPVQLKERSVTKSGRTYQRLDRFTNGTAVSRWWVDGTLVGKADDGAYIISDYKDLGPFSYQNSDFPDLTWIGPGCYSRVEAVEDVDCFVFEKVRPRASDVELQEMSPDDRVAAEKDLVETTVWISRETGLPVQESTPDRTEIYTFLPPPTTAVALPPAAARKLALHQARETQLTRRGPAP